MARGMEAPIYIPEEQERFELVEDAAEEEGGICSAPVEEEDIKAEAEAADVGQDTVMEIVPERVRPEREVLLM